MDMLTFLLSLWYVLLLNKFYIVVYDRSCMAVSLDAQRSRGNQNTVTPPRLHKLLDPLNKSLMRTSYCCQLHAKAYFLFLQ
eukprot:snap_masked-scaffold_45-processed-gene-1.60-mRNA-1 protein AED:1.00 eAED:1.00 QI:0/0/0/0/1/1/4/0/80